MKSTKRSLLGALALFCLPAILPSFAHAEEVVKADLGVAQTDEQIIAEMTAKSKAIQRELLSTSDSQEQIRLQRSLITLIEDTLPKLTPTMRALMSVGVKIVSPLVNDAGAYTKSAAEFFESDRAIPGTASSLEEIAARLAVLKGLKSSNEGIISRISSLDADAERLLLENKIGSAERAGFMEGFRQSTSAKFGAVRAIRNLEARFYDQYILFYELQQKEWGHWEARADHTISWENEEVSAAAQKILDEIQVIGQRQLNAQEVLKQRI